MPQTQRRQDHSSGAVPHPAKEPSGRALEERLLAQLRAHDVPFSAFPLVWYVWIRAGEDGVCYASNKTFREELGCSERHVRASLRGLVTSGILKAEVRRSPKGDPTTTEYRFTPDAFKPMASAPGEQEPAQLSLDGRAGLRPIEIEQVEATNPEAEPATDDHQMPLPQGGGGARHAPPPGTRCPTPRHEVPHHVERSPLKEHLESADAAAGVSSASGTRADRFGTSEQQQQEASTAKRRRGLISALAVRYRERRHVFNEDLAQSIPIDELQRLKNALDAQDLSTAGMQQLADRLAAHQPAEQPEIINDCAACGADLRELDVNPDLGCPKCESPDFATPVYFFGA